ncbi:hypothetical protein EV179_005190 [Coemansia sp. RSA 487]|nr:hypothetical protein IW138_005574 [Coemansia sp. RSA 986]KAJ2211819.1 hypothetical protein EV179_005190 [Coemansia sp. RSA 487]
MFSAAFRPTLKEHGLYYLRILFICLFMLWIPLCLFYGAVYKRTSFAHLVRLKIVDFDQGPVGNAITQALLVQNQPSDHTRAIWQESSNDRNFRSVRDVSEWVRKNGWAVLVIHSNASRQLELALADTETYNPEDAMTLFVSSGHNPIIYSLMVASTTAADLGKATNAFAIAMVREIQSGSVNVDIPSASALLGAEDSAKVLAVLFTQPISYRQIDVAPFTFDIAPVVYLFCFLVGMLCTIGPMIGWKMSSFSFYLKVRHRDLWLSIVGLIFAWTIIFGMYGALAFSAFRGLNYSENALKYTVGRFFSLWATIAITLMAVALWLFCWFTLLPPEVLGLASVVTLLPNVVSSISIAELAPHFYRWMHALPFYNGAILYRHILSGGYPRIGANLGIILGEICTMSLILCALTWIRQLMVLCGISDAAGWVRGNIFFHSPVPYYKEKAESVTT